MNALRSTDIKDIKDNGDHYHFIFRLYDYETFLPASSIVIYGKSRMYEKLTYAYVKRYLRQDEPDFGFLNDECQFYEECGLPKDYSIYHLLIPKSNKEIDSAIIDGSNDFEVILEEMGGMVRLVILVVDSKLKRNEKLKKIKDKICQV